MTDELSRLVSVESPSTDRSATSACADAVDELASRLLGVRAERTVADGHVHLRWKLGAGEPSVLLIGHFDTVWPAGTLARWPFAVRDGRATGPGAFDMKAGIVQGFFGLAALAEVADEGADAFGHVQILMTSDEEIGSRSSRPLIEELASGMRAALVLEPSAAGALKTGRKGVSMYTVDIEGKAAHAGLEPEKGANALVELAHQVLAATALARPAEGTTVTTTLATAGTAVNVVPAAAQVKIDVRAATPEEQQRVHDDLHALSSQVPGTRVAVTGEPNRPPLPVTASAELFARAQRIAAGLGLPELGGVEVGGGSDGNITAGLGVPTLDGLGAVGDGAHAEGEYVVLSAMAERAALLAALVYDLRLR